MNPLLSKYLFYFPATIIKGENVLKYVSSYRKFQYASRADIEAYQLRHLQKLIKHASQNSAYYRDAFKNAGIQHNDVKSLNDIRMLPLLTKQQLNAHIHDIETTRNNPFYTKKTTGGSTGQAVTLLKNPDALARERAATARSYEWAGVGIGDSQARFWGIPLHQKTKLQSRIIDIIANRRRYSAFAVDASTYENYYRDIVKFRPKYIYGYASSVQDFARFVAERGYKLPASVKTVITTSEVLTKDIRNVIQSSLNVRVFNEYGCGEVGSIAHECEQGSMHIMEDNLIVEIDNGGSDEASGEIIVTDLFNYATPLIRYRIGDYASISRAVCSCGKSFRSFENVHGRAYDCITSPDGKKFHPEFIMYIFEDIKNKLGGIKQFQVIQTEIDHLQVRLVLESEFSDELRNLVETQITAKLHPSMKISYEFTEHIDREASGKIRLVKSLI